MQARMAAQITSSPAPAASAPWKATSSSHAMSRIERPGCPPDPWVSSSSSSIER